MTYLKFNKLPLEIQERLLKRQRGKIEGLAFKTTDIFIPFILLVASLVWFGIVFYLSNDYLWSKFELIILTLISLVAAYVFLQNLYILIRWYSSASKSYLLITPHYVINIYFNDVFYWNLEQLITINSKHSYQNGKYKFTRITLNLENDTKTFKIKNLESAEYTIEQINYLRKLFIEAVVRNDETYLNSNDDFAESNILIDKQNKFAVNKNLGSFLTAATSAVLTVGIMLGAVSLNNYYDDKKSWDDAQTNNRASAVRFYLQTHSQGRWADDANLKLQSLYDAAEQKYKSALIKGFDQKVTDAILDALSYAKTTQNFRVKVVFERHNEMPPNIVEQLKKEYETERILELGDTFSSEKMSGRENLLLTVIADAFKRVIPEDILEVSSQCSAECVTFPVKYKINSKDVYYDLRQKDIPEDERTYYPGISIYWDFGVNIPNKSQTYTFSLASVPADEISYESNSSEVADPNKDFADVLNSEKNNIYDSMVSSAFDDFRKNLVSRLGVGEMQRTEIEQPNNDEKLQPKQKLKSKAEK